MCQCDGRWLWNTTVWFVAPRRLAMLTRGETLAVSPGLENQYQVCKTQSSLHKLMLQNGKNDVNIFEARLYFMIPLYCECRTIKARAKNHGLHSRLFTTADCVHTFDSALEVVFIKHWNVSILLLHVAAKSSRDDIMKWSNSKHSVSSLYPAFFLSLFPRCFYSLQSESRFRPHGFQTWARFLTDVEHMLQIKKYMYMKKVQSWKTTAFKTTKQNTALIRSIKRPLCGWKTHAISGQKHPSRKTSI